MDAADGVAASGAESNDRKSGSRDVAPTAQKRRIPDSLRLTDDSDDENTGTDDKRLKTTFDSDNFKCSICLNIWYDVVSVSPCQHNFCNACFSDWYRRARTHNGGCKCPQCRVDLIYAGRNYAMRGLVEDLLASHPAYKRSAEDIAKMDKSSLIKSNFVKLADLMAPAAHTPPRTAYTPPRTAYIPPPARTFTMGGFSDDEEETGESDDDDDDDDDVQGSCRQCGANNSTFNCQPGTVHLTCGTCFLQMPERTDLTIPQKCAACMAVCCDAYWRSQNVPANPGQGMGCTGNGRLQPMNERQITSIPHGAHSGNRIEQEFTKEYLTQHRLALEAVVREWMAKVDNSEFELPNMRITSTSPICNTCTDKVVTHLLDKFRMSVPKTEMPPEAAQRDNCWYGLACRTQRHKPDHAKKLNHVCEPSRQVS